MWWFLDNTTLLDKERTVIADLCGEVDWIKSDEWKILDSKLVLIVEMMINETSHILHLKYPSHYPTNPPVVIPAKRTKLSTHQYGTDGELCLEWGPDNWVDGLTGADMLKSAFKLLSLEAENTLNDGCDIIPSRHLLEIGQEIRSNEIRFIANHAFIYETLAKCSDVEKATFELFLCEEKATIFLKEVQIEGQEKPVVDLDIPVDVHKLCYSIKGVVVKTNLPEEEFASNFPEEIVEQVDKIIPFLSLLDEGVSFVLLFSSSGEIHLFFTFNKKEWTKTANIPINITNNERLGKKYCDLENKRVGIVGLGSAGSKIAMTLCRSGVREFYLVDHDIFMPENICRHTLDWKDIGQHKVDSISRDLKLIHPDVKVRSRKVKLSGQEASGGVDNILSSLGQCDLIIDATADSITFNQLSSVSSHSKKPFLWLEIFPGGFGGYIARYRPEMEPDPKTMRAKLSIYMQKNDFPKIESTEKYQANINNEIMQADDADVSIVSAHLAKMALDILIENNPSIYDNSLYLVGIGKEWVFTQAFHTIPMDFRNTQSEIIEESISHDKISENLTFISELIEKSENGNTSSKRVSNKN